MPADVKYEDHVNLLRHFAGKVVRRLNATGTVTTQFDDILQECSIAWCVARDRWSEDAGVPFVAFLMQGLKWHINRFAGGEIIQYNASHVDLDAPLGDNGNDDLGHDIIPDHSIEQPEEATLTNDRRVKQLARLTPRSRQFVELLESPPKCLVDIVQALRARRQYAIERGVFAAAAPKRVQAGLVFRFMGCSRAEQMKIMNEIERVFNLKAALSALDGVK